MDKHSTLLQGQPPRIMTHYHVVGTSHIATESKIIIDDAIKNTNPALLCVELDVARADALFRQEKSKVSFALVRSLGLFGLLFYLFGAKAQRTIGKAAGMSPGDEFLHALRSAAGKGIPVALVDQPISITLQNLSRKVPVKEKWRLLCDLIFIRGPKVKIDLQTVPSEETVSILLNWFESKFPNLYAVLVEDRNKYMIEHIVAAGAKHPGEVLVVVGAGHKTVIEKRLFKLSVQEISNSDQITNPPNA